MTWQHWINKVEAFIIALSSKVYRLCQCRKIETFLLVFCLSHHADELLDVFLPSPRASLFLM